MLFSPFMMRSCVYILHNLLQEVLNCRLAHNGLFTAVLVCLDLSSYLCVIFLYSQMSKNPMFRGCSYNTSSSLKAWPMGWYLNLVLATPCHHGGVQCLRMGLSPVCTAHWLGCWVSLSCKAMSCHSHRKPLQLPIPSRVASHHCAFKIFFL